MIPVKFNNFMLKVWQGEKENVIQFILQYLIINKQIFKTWDDLKDDFVLNES